ncbi:hypothetical protein SDC9_174145 [bioreactor metagenome]|uniref:Uncharacterized protein n=1 Tax=bioreactor metagenome TaxID=1076179 RepID=A0A645GKQ1_9ZZZZ
MLGMPCISLYIPQNIGRSLVLEPVQSVCSSHGESDENGVYLASGILVDPKIPRCDGFEYTSTRFNIVIDPFGRSPLHNSVLGCKLVHRVEVGLVQLGVHLIFTDFQIVVRSVDSVRIFVILTNEGELEPTHGRGDKISMIAVDEGIQGKDSRGVVELHRLDRIIRIAEFTHPMLHVSTSLPTECLIPLTDGLEDAPFGCYSFCKRIIALLFYRLSAAQIIAGSVVESNYYSIHDCSLGN